MNLIRALTVGTVAVGLWSLCPAWAPALAQDAAPYPAVIDAPKVEARSGAGRAFYPVGELQRGDQVVVVDEYWDWYRIQAPQGVYMFVLRRDVDAKGDGTRGVVNTDLTRVYAAGMNRSAADSFKFTMNLQQGDEVKIVATDGDHYKIAPPAGALVFLPPGTIKPLEAGQDPPAPTPADAQTPRDDMVPLDAEPPSATPLPDVAWEGQNPPPAEVPADTAAPDPAPPADAETTAPPLVLNVPPTAPADPTPAADADMADVDEPMNDLATGDDTPPALPADAPPVPVETPAITPALREVELAQLPLFASPVESQPLDDMQRAYETVADQLAEEGTELPLVDQRILEVRLATIQRNRQFAAALAQIKQRQQAVPRVDPVKEPVKDDEPFAAVGVLRASSVFSGEGMPQMFRVIDPATRRTIAYVRAARGVDPSAALGQLVGIKGQREFDPSLNTHLITAQQVTVLDPAGS